MTAGASVRDGLCVFRVRRRGAANEATICELLVPGNDAGTRRALLKDVAERASADYVILAGHAARPSSGCVPLPRQGPILTWRAVRQLDAPDLSDWNLSLGDIELF